MVPNEVWAVDFMSDALYHGRRFRTFNVLDEGVREGLDIVIDTSIPSGRVVRTLVDDHLARDYHSFEWNGRDDNGRAVGSGVYIYQLRVGRRTLSQKMVLMK